MDQWHTTSSLRFRALLEDRKLFHVFLSHVLKIKSYFKIKKSEFGVSPYLLHKQKKVSSSSKTLSELSKKQYLILTSKTRLLQTISHLNDNVGCYHAIGFLLILFDVVLYCGYVRR